VTSSTTAAVKGIGGVFIESPEPARLAAWYADVLGISMEPHDGGERGYFHVFQARDMDNPALIRNNPVFAIQPPAEPLETGANFVVNLRIDDLAAFVESLNERGYNPAPVTGDPFGWFSSLRDPEGNRLELYEERFPDDSD
jgi:predicted enzyme related to lactoylglutathione lyase